MLRRQLRRCFGDLLSIPQECRGFIETVKDTYREFEADRKILERSLELSSQELLQANSEMRAIFQAFPDLLMRLDCSGVILDYQTGGTKDFLLEPKDPVGKRIQDIKHKDIAAKFQDAIQQIQENKSLVIVEYSLMIQDRKQVFEARLLPLLEDQIIVIIRNITERKEAEEALISSNQRLNDIIEFLPDATLVIDGDRKIIAWNRAIEEMTGVSKDEMIGKDDRECTVYFYGRRRPFLMDLLDSNHGDVDVRYDYIERKGNVLCAETYVPCVYGNKGAHVFATAAPLLDRLGNRVGAIESIRDISESKKKEEELKESQQQLADIINFLPDATFVIDTEGKVIAWNRAIEEMTGTSAREMLGKGDYEYALPFYGERRPILIDLVLMPEQDIEGRYENVVRSGNVLAGEVYTTRLRAGEVYLFATACILHDSKGNVVGAIESIRDITERKRVEEALIQAEQKYRGIFENAMEGIYQTTLDGHFISVNPAFARMIGYDSPDELMHAITDIGQQIYVDPESRSAILGLLESQGTVQGFEVQFWRKDGTTAWISLNVHAVPDKEGKIRYIEGTAQDITDRKLLETRLIQAQKMEAIGTLAGGIAHDFNNILSPIIGYSELVLNQLDEDSPLRGNITQVVRSGHRAKELVKQILAFSRQTEQECKPVQLSSVIRETLSLIRPTIPSTIQIRHNVDADAALSSVIADPTQMHQVLMNLCTNASHAMRERGGTLRIDLSRVDLDSSAASQYSVEPGSYLCLSVSDTGHGMDEEVKQRIFDPYFTTKGPFEGTGLGLAVVYGIVKGLHGGIAVFSEPGRGTTFQILLPLAERAEVSSADFAPVSPFGEGHVLLVDDETLILDVMKEIVQRMGYEVTARQDSLDALETFRSQPEGFDLIITDQTMPQMTGADLAREILKIRSDVPIILCTGFSDIIDENRAKEIGIRGYLMKPVRIEDLARMIHQVTRGE